MSKLWKMTTFAVVAVIAMALSTGAFAAEEKKAEGKKPAGQQLTGEIVSIDKDCIKIKARSGEEMFSITSATKFGTKAEPKSCSDFKAGDKVTVRFKTEGDKKCATAVAAPVAKKKETK